MIFLEKLSKDELRKRRNADKRERYHWYVSHGICPFCLNDAQPGRVRCAVCLEKNYASHQKHDANRTEKQKSDYRFNAKRLEIGCMPMFLDCIAETISWNIWQMDGLKKTVPGTDIPCKIKDWKADKEILFKDAREEK